VTHMNASHFTDDDGNLISGPAVPKTDVHGYWTDEWAWNTDVNWRNDGSPYIIFADVEERLQAINVNYDVFGQKAACRIDLSEAKRQYGEVQ